MVLQRLLESVFQIVLWRMLESVLQRVLVSVHFFGSLFVATSCISFQTLFSSD